MKALNLNQIVRVALEKAGIKQNERRGARIRTDKNAQGKRVCRVNWVMSVDIDLANKFLPKGFKFEKSTKAKSNTWVLVEC